MVLGMECFGLEVTFTFYDLSRDVLYSMIMTFFCILPCGKLSGICLLIGGDDGSCRKIKIGRRILLEYPDLPTSVDYFACIPQDPDRPSSKNLRGELHHTLEVTKICKNIPIVFLSALESVQMALLTMANG